MFKHLVVGGLTILLAGCAMLSYGYDIETAVSPIVGTIKQSEELVEHLLAEYEEDPAKLWESNIFGKTLNELVNDGLKNKLDRMPEEAQAKLRETLERIINEGSGGLLCLIL